MCGFSSIWGKRFEENLYSEKKILQVIANSKQKFASFGQRKVRKTYFVRQTRRNWNRNATKAELLLKYCKDFEISVIPEENEKVLYKI